MIIDPWHNSWKVAIHTEIIPQDSLVIEQGAEVSQQGSEATLLDLVVLLVQHKRFIFRFVASAAVLSVVISLLLPVQYEGTAVLLPPSQNTSLASAMMGQISSGGSMGGTIGALGALGALTGMKSQTDMYVSFLKSRTVEDSMIQRFGLMAEYHEKRMSDARKAFERHATVAAGTKDGLIRITVEDGDAKRAAEMANGYVEEFRKLSETLAITEAARRRLFFERELQDAKKNLSTAEEEMRRTQQSTGVLQIDSQAKALIESVAMLRAQVVAKEVQIQGMRSFAAEDNPDLVLAKQQLGALQKQLAQLAGSQHDTGSDIVLSKGRVTESGMQYLRRFRDLKYYEAIYELLIKGLEVAKLDEAKEGEIVQVVDPAITADRKSSPHRAIIVLASTIVGFFLAVFWIVVRQSVQRTLDVPENSERWQEIKRYWKGKTRS